MIERIAVVGGGLVGLATARALILRYPHLQLTILEKEDTVAAHQSGRNSGVIHSGIYYTPGSLKATLCREGRASLVSFCEEQNVAYDTCGKVIVATSEDEVERLHGIYSRGQENEIRCEIVDPSGLRELEPAAQGVAAIHVPDAGIVDYPGVAQKLGELITEAGGRIEKGFDVQGFERTSQGVQVCSSNNVVAADLVINCAGLYSDRIARMAGADPGMMIVPFRGVYYELRPAARALCRNLIYPVPDPAYPFLGVHFTRMIDGSVEVGPNAVLAMAREGYSLSTWNAGDLIEAVRYKGFRHLAANHWRKGLLEMHRTVSRSAYLKALTTLVPSVSVDDLVPCRSGIRAQAVRPDGSMVDDFVIADQDDMVHVCNAPSPAATACLAIGEHIMDHAAQRF